ncbi:glutamate-rich WD repeat-containing protein 1 [Canna indica]|uniref:Glutamate-rich WD repeat-containing protein 1 n=1 Tax=Canna indica TaxID=4628 RepID=A0AAQ3KFG2_9LILI|nr:glutamate-rich WD repeat-containing protein 1 [Canna indica]
MLVWDISSLLNALAESVSDTTVGGDCNSSIHLWEPSAETWNMDATPFVGHTASVEDLQWSPTEADVFASCSVDGTIAIWDTRLGKSSAVSVKAHNTDVNVISSHQVDCVLPQLVPCLYSPLLVDLLLALAYPSSHDIQPLTLMDTKVQSLSSLLYTHLLAHGYLLFVDLEWLAFFATALE